MSVEAGCIGICWWPAARSPPGAAVSDVVAWLMSVLTASNRTVLIVSRLLVPARLAPLSSFLCVDCRRRGRSADRIAATGVPRRQHARRDVAWM